jgi:hypothetical protein
VFGSETEVQDRKNNNKALILLRSASAYCYCLVNERLHYSAWGGVVAEASTPFGVPGDPPPPPAAPCRPRRFLLSSFQSPY